ncbi:MAG: helix-turn-helix transcriptional regulator [Candidatus Sumerlaeota bacterium]|nr:helix-turn-helix transcriptional regulator [Candidatus Sumerlaeota bacterium]
MKNYLGEQIHSHREVLNMTQDQFGSKYDVSGPAVFKFEKGYVKPSLDLWLKMAKDFGVPQRKAVLLWVKSKLPEEYQDFIDLAGEVAEGGKAGVVAMPSNSANMQKWDEEREQLVITNPGWFVAYQDGRRVALEPSLDRLVAALDETLGSPRRPCDFHEIVERAEVERGPSPRLMV